jgi:hypothetical protein
MAYKLNKKKALGYLVIIFVGFILSYTAATSDSRGYRTAEKGQSLDLKKGAQFIGKRSTVAYIFEKEEKFTEISRIYGLRLNEELLKKHNRGLDEELLRKKIPKGTELQLPIQLKHESKIME